MAKRIDPWMGRPHICFVESLTMTERLCVHDHMNPDGTDEKPSVDPLTADLPRALWPLVTKAKMALFEAICERRVPPTARLVDAKIEHGQLVISPSHPDQKLSDALCTIRTESERFLL